MHWVCWDWWHTMLDILLLHILEFREHVVVVLLLQPFLVLDDEEAVAEIEQLHFAEVVNGATPKEALP